MSLDKMERFLARIRRACKLKTVKEETDVNIRPTDENRAPDMPHGPDVSDSGEDSPSPSCGPYIPISQCVTGKPVRYMGQQTYSNTSFPFPPEVNWATYPKKEFSPSHHRSSATAPPRPPKKSPSVNVNTSTPVSGGGALCTKMPENIEDNHDSSSTSSSLHSPPGSAGVLYSNVPDMSPLNKSPTEVPGGTVSHSLPSSGDPKLLSPVSPPKIDRNLKPDLRRPAESPGYISSQQSPGNKFTTQYPSGTKTLPSKNNQRVSQSPGSTNRKPPSHFTLGPTPAQIRIQKENNLPKAYSQKPNASSTLPNRKRLIGPAHISPHDKNPHVFPEKDANQELTYLVIDCANIPEGESKPAAIKNPTHHRSHSAIHSSDSSSVEYRLIDHIKTQALIDAMQDREQQLRTNHTNKHIK